METGTTMAMESTTETVFSQLGIGDCSTWWPPMWVYRATRNQKPASDRVCELSGVLVTRGITK